MHGRFLVTASTERSDNSDPTFLADAGAIPILVSLLKQSNEASLIHSASGTNVMLPQNIQMHSQRCWKGSAVTFANARWRFLPANPRCHASLERLWGRGRSCLRSALSLYSMHSTRKDLQLFKPERGVELIAEVIKLFSKKVTHENALMLYGFSVQALVTCLVEAMPWWCLGRQSNYCRCSSHRGLRVARAFFWQPTSSSGEGAFIPCRWLYWAIVPSYWEKETLKECLTYIRPCRRVAQF